MNELTIKNACTNKINELYNLYKNKDNVIEYLYTYINDNLPKILEKESNKKIKNENDEELIFTEKEDFFINFFLYNNKIFYLSNTNYFYIYNGKNYTTMKEDDLHYKILLELSSSNIDTLKKLKHKAKLFIVSQIKEKRNLLYSVPETYTIQKILNFLTPQFFPTKNEAKYFLSIIGDNIFKKNKDLYFITLNKKKLLLHFFNDIKNIVISHINLHTNIVQNFVSKYNIKYNYNNCRLFHINNINYSEEHSNFIKSNALNIICVATHYSSRFSNSENFLNYDYIDLKFKNYALFLLNNNEENIIDNFINECLEDIETNTNTNDKLYICWKDIIFIWKNYLLTNKYPNILYLKKLKNYLINKLNFDESRNIFLNITSNFLPSINSFLTFWKNNIVIVPNIFSSISSFPISNYSSLNNKTNFLHELELNEIFILYKKWLKKETQQFKYNNITENDILKILNHYYKELHIIDNKYVTNVYAKNWNKNNDIDIILDIYKIKNKNNFISVYEYKCELIFIDDIYNFYTKYYEYLDKILISKGYFEKYIKYKLSNFIEYNNFISINWFNSSI